MLVRSIKAFKDYTGTRDIGAGRLFFAYAVERFHSNVMYYVIPIDVKFDHDEYDPLFFDANNFEIVEDKAKALWVTRKVDVPRGSTEYSSFPEWFENDFYIRAHDWDLRGEDYTIMRKYKEKYEDLYKDHLSK